MKLTEDYEISIDERNVILRHYVAPVEKTKKASDGRVGTGEFTAGHFETVGYYRTHQAALRAWVNMELRETPQTVSELLLRLDEVMEVIGKLEISYVYQCNCKRKTEEEQ